ncbi:hypothetical protein MUP95_08555 [bacterium]|nr:hypothetical protein [bacterium]
MFIKVNNVGIQKDIEIMNMGQIRRFVLFVLIGWGCGCAYTQQNDFYEVLSLYEKRMNQSAENWLQEEYGKALDSFHSATDLLSANMPSPSNMYFWSEFCALKTYTLLLTRMVEVDQHCSEGQSELCKEVIEQALSWSDILKEQTGIWIQIDTSRSDDFFSRLLWIKRFESAIYRAQKLKT